MLKHYILVPSAICMLAACNVDQYEAGDTSYSYLKAEMADMHTVAKNKVDYATTDQGEKLTFAPPFTCNWTTKPDTTYRAMLYYNLSEEKTQAVLAANVWVLHPTKTAKDTTTDPVKIESCWLSNNKKYINLRLGVMNGQPEEEKPKHKIGIAIKDTIVHPNGQRTIKLQFLHNQNNIPQYYTTTVYISIPTSQYHSGDIIQININTYNGIIKKEFSL